MSRLFKRVSVQDLLTTAAILGLAVLGCTLLSRALTWGVWAYSDSAEYIVSARMLVAGRGLGTPSADGGFMFLSLHPPFYPLVISLFLLFGIDPLDALPVFNLTLFVVTILLSGGLIYYLTRNPLLSISCCALVMLPPTMLRNFDGAMTEPLYIPLSIAGTLLLAWYWQQPRRRLVIAAGMIAGLAGLVRYTGLALLAAGVLVILLTRRPLRQRLKDAALFIALSAGPLLIWFIYLYAQSGLLAARSFSTIALFEKVFLLRKSVMETLVTWVPYLNKAQSWSIKALGTYVVAAIGLAAGGVGCWRVFRKNARSSPEIEHGVKLMAAAFISATAYLVFVAGSFLFSSITPDIDDRTLSPLLPLLMIFLCAALFVTPCAFGLKRIFLIVPLMLVLVSCQFYYNQTRSLAGDRDQSSRGYAAPRWRTSELMQAMSALPSGTPLISNMPVAVLLYTDRMPYAIQELEYKQAQENPASFGSGADSVEEIFRQRGAALILFQPELTAQMSELYGEAGPDRAASFVEGLRLIRQAQDGAIYTYR